MFINASSPFINASSPFINASCVSINHGRHPHTVYKRMLAFINACSTPPDNNLTGRLQTPAARQSLRKDWRFETDGRDTLNKSNYYVVVRIGGLGFMHA